MLESVVVYFSLAFLMILCGALVSRRKSLAGPGGVSTARFNCAEMWIPILTFSIVFGCRWMVGEDYDHYIFQYLNGCNERFEPLFSFLMTGMSSLGIHYSVFFAVIAFIEIFCIYYAIKDYKFSYPYVAFLLIIGFWFLSLSNILRQQLAACIFLIAIKYIHKRKPLKYYLLVLVAFLFHKSAILLVFVYPLLRWKSDWFKNIYVQLGLFALALFLSSHYMMVVKLIEIPFDIVVNKMGYSQYSFGVLLNDTFNDRTKFGANSGFGKPAQIVKYLPVILYSARMKKYYNDSYFNLLYTLWFVGMFTSFAFGSSIVLTRPFIYSQNLLYILPAFFFNYCFKTKRPFPQMLAVGMMGLYVLLFFNLIIHGDMNTSAFTFFWQHLSE